MSKHKLSILVFTESQRVKIGSFRLAAAGWQWCAELLTTKIYQNLSNSLLLAKLLAYFEK